MSRFINFASSKISGMNELSECFLVLYPEYPTIDLIFLHIHGYSNLNVNILRQINLSHSSNILLSNTRKLNNK